MRCFFVFASLMAFAVGRPDVSHLQQAGYQYSRPSSGGSSAVASGGGSYRNGDSRFGGSSNGYSTVDYPSSGSSSNGNSLNGQNFDSSLGSSSSGNAFGGSNYASGQGISSGNVNLEQGQSQSIDLTGRGGAPRVIYKPVIKEGEPIITKNFYVHAAPEEDENVRVEEKVHLVRRQKNYKIIFIKAPSSGASHNAANYPIYPQNEEKTIVYVLSKKDSGVVDTGDIPEVLPSSVTHKPEVFFINYKTKQEAVDAVSQIQAQYQSGASSGSSVSGQDFRITESNNEEPSGTDASFLPLGGNSNGNGAKGTFSSTSSSFGPSGGQTSYQAGTFGQNGGSTISNQAVFGQNNGHSLESVDAIPPEFVRTEEDQSAYAAQNRQQAYLPPNRRY